MRKLRYSKVRTQVELTKLSRCRSVYKFTSLWLQGLWFLLGYFLTLLKNFCNASLKWPALLGQEQIIKESRLWASTEALFKVRWVSSSLPLLRADYADSQAPAQTSWTRIYILTRSFKCLVNTWKIQTSISGKPWLLGTSADVPRRT